MSMILCTACQRPTDAFLCWDCADLLDRAFGDLPGLVHDVATAAVRETRVYRTQGKPRQPDEDWRGAEHALEGFTMPIDLDAADLLHRSGNTLATWARHMAESRDVPLAIETGREMQGPVCAGHVHDYRTEGCGHHPDRCKQYHPGHVHATHGRGCGLVLDPETEEVACQRHHCDHPSCGAIRRGVLTGSAAELTRWFLRNRNSIRMDEAAADMLTAMTGLVADLRRAVDRSPSPFWAGPCHAEVDEVITETRDGTVYIHTERIKCDRDLYAWPGREDEIKCDGYRSRVEGDQGCGTVHTPVERRAWLTASVEDQLLPLSMIQTSLPRLFPNLLFPRRSTWWKWIAAGRLHARSVDRAGVEMFRGGDAIDLVRNEQRRIRGNVAAYESKRARAAS